MTNFAHYYESARDDMKQIDQATWQWIETHRNDDPDRLRLSAHGDPNRLFAITQIECRRRTRRKLADTLLRIPFFTFPSTLSAQQSTSDVLAEYHADLTDPNAIVLDMTGGLGIDALHISRRCRHITVFEQNPAIAECTAANFQAAGANNVTVICGDSSIAIKDMADNTFDCIFIDPARRGDHDRRLFALSDCSPDVTQLLNQMLRVSRQVIIKVSPMLDITETLHRLDRISRIIAIGTPSECKELVIMCRRDSDKEVEIGSVTLSTDSGNLISEFSFRGSEELESTPAFASPQPSHILYDPYPATRKTGCRALLCQRFGVNRIAPNTSLYCSVIPVKGFPGPAFEIIDIKELGKKALREIATQYPEIDVTVKNLPMTAAELSKKLHCRPSGKIRLIACTDADGAKLLIVCRRIATS